MVGMVVVVSFSISGRLWMTENCSQHARVSINWPTTPCKCDSSTSFDSYCGKKVVCLTAR